MIVVVADTSPLNYLIQIHCDHVLPALYERVFVPAAVVEELDHPRTTAAVRTWLANTPAWLVVEQVDEPVDPQLARLDPGSAKRFSWRSGHTLTCCSWTKGSVYVSHVHMDLPLRVRWARCCKRPGAAWSTSNAPWRISRQQIFDAATVSSKKCVVTRRHRHDCCR